MIRVATQEELDPKNPYGRQMHDTGGACQGHGGHLGHYCPYLNYLYICYDCAEFDYCECYPEHMLGGNA